jgi:hypothetical protein
MKYLVECQTIKTYTIEADSEEEAQLKGEELLESDMINNNIDWGIYATPIKPYFKTTQNNTLPY